MKQVTRVGCLVRSLKSFVNYPHVYTTSPQIYVTARGVGSKILFVGGISNKVKEEELRSAFALHGEILEARLSVDARSKISRGFGFIKYASVKEAEAAMKLMNGQVLSGKRIRVAYAVSEPKYVEGKQA